MNDIQQKLLAVLKESLFSTGQNYSIEIDSDSELLHEAKQQAVLCLVASNERKDVSKIISQNIQIAYENAEIEREFDKYDIPHATIKGIAAAIYYQDPWLRMSGDIDLIVPKDSFEKAYKTLVELGYRPECPLEGDDREIPFYKDKTVVELHRRYASLNSLQQEELLDRWIMEAIPKTNRKKIEDDTFTILPPIENGLVLLSHISHHLENGLGLRHIIDWLMYVHCCLHDDSWPVFKEKTDQLGLTKLAQVLTRLGQIYLGLSEENISWCKEADEPVCSELLDYIFECGNFGTKLGMNNTVTMILSHGKGVKGFFRNLQKRGEEHWSAYHRHHWLKPLCWLYQGIRYLIKGIQNRNNLKKLGKNLESSKKRYQLMEALGATQIAKQDMDES